MIKILFIWTVNKYIVLTVCNSHFLYKMDFMEANLQMQYETVEQFWFVQGRDNRFSTPKW